MSFVLRFTLEAEFDYEDALIFYEKAESGLSVRFAVELDELFERIREHPQAYSPIFTNYRLARLRVFYNHAVVYRLVGETILVVAIPDGRNAPDKLEKRLGNS